MKITSFIYAKIIITYKYVKGVFPFMKKIFAILSLFTVVLVGGFNLKDTKTLKNTNRLFAISETVTETTTENELADQQSKFFDNFISPFVLLIGALDLSVVISCAISIATNKKRKRQEDENSKATQEEFKKLTETVNNLINVLTKTTEFTKKYSEKINKDALEIADLLSKNIKSGKVTKETNKLILNILEEVVAHCNELVTNGCAEHIVSQIEDYKKNNK